MGSERADGAELYSGDLITGLVRYSNKLGPYANYLEDQMTEKMTNRPKTQKAVRPKKNDLYFFEPNIRPNFCLFIIYLVVQSWCNVLLLYSNVEK